MFTIILNVMSNQDLEDSKIRLIYKDLGVARKILSCDFRLQVVLSKKMIHLHFRHSKQDVNKICLFLVK